MTDETSKPSGSGLGPVSWFVLIALVVVPPVFATGFTRYDTARWAILSLLTAAALVVWGVQVVRRKKVDLVGGKVLALLVGFGAMAGFSVLWSHVPLLGLAEAVQWLSLVVLFLVVVGPGGRPLRFGDVAVATAVGTSVAGLFGVLDFLGVELFTAIWDPPGATGAFDAREFGTPYYAIALPLLVASIIRLEGPARIVASVGLALGAFHFGLLADWLSLGVFVGGALVTTLAVAALQGLRRGVVLLYPALGILGLVTIVAAIPGVAFEAESAFNEATRLPLVTNEQPSEIDEQGRVRNANFAPDRWEVVPTTNAYDYINGIAFDLFRERPVVGEGAAGWWLNQTRHPHADHAYVERMFRYYPAFRTPHNGYLKILVEFGLVGLLLFLAFLASVVGITAHALATKQEAENWLLEHWSLTTACVLGALFLLFTPAIELAAPAALWFVALAMLTRESAVLNEFKGLSSVWTINASEQRRWDTTVFAGVIPAACGLAMLVPIALHTSAKYYQGWGDLMMLRMQYEKAIEAYETAFEIYPADGLVRYNEVLAHQRLGKLTEAVEEVNELVQLRPYDARGAYFVSLLHIQNQKYADAVKAARRATELFPNYIEARRSALTIALDLQARTSEAAEQLLKVLELDPPATIRAGVHRQLGSYYEGPLEQLPKAIEHYEKHLELTEDPQQRDRYRAKIGEMRKQIERERLQREGKPIPMELLPGDVPQPHPGHRH